MQITDLPEIDVVTVSHNHYDHLDIPSLKKLSKESKNFVFSSKGRSKIIESKGY